ncbi:hypothetical protein SAMN04487958_1078 [Vreelandella subterranea]|uniref:Uncharacterized protein n=1 Tax=Vreelandella subterranea TaxID=416874 RepID=A0A1H9UI80_9GAMM|nr:hypothetical protein [Halomonas subterranea]SES09250.1 hypothetical protein SAMN04487958_1078 [Halomonas subterranea]
MSGTELMQSSVGLVHRSFMEWKFEKLLRKAEAHGLTEEELRNSDHRFALYMRVGRAFEICSEVEVVDYIADAMIGGIRCGDADKRPDFAQMAISALNGVTKTELNLILLMHEHGLWGTTDEEILDESGFEGFQASLGNYLGLNDLSASAILNGLTRTGLVTPQASGVGNAVNIQGNRLTQLARDLFKYVDYARRLTT